VLTAAEEKSSRHWEAASTSALLQPGPQIGSSAGGAFQGSVTSQCAMAPGVVKKHRR
jgi:hypothetical protein